MQTPLSFAKYTTGSVLFLALFSFNLFALQSPVLGTALLIFCVLFFGRYLGERLVADGDFLAQCLIGSSALLAAFSLVGSLAYYLDALNQTTVAVMIVLTPLVVFALYPREQRANEEMRRDRPSAAMLMSGIAIAILAIAVINVLIGNPILEPVRSPWLVVPSVFFFGIFLISLLVAARPSKWMLCLFFFLIVGVALLAYPLGYGFDPFIHKATERHIFENGTITPKPLYYAGQYALVLIAAHGFTLPIDVADNLLVPLLAALLIPLSAFVGFRALLRRTNPSAPLIAALSIFLVPLTSFITTTPQGLANLWSLLALFATFPILIAEQRSWKSFLVPALFAAAALITHPLAGIPIAIYLALLAVRPRLPVIIAGSFALPLVFVANALISHLPLTINFSNLASTSIADLFHLSLFLQNRFHPFLDAAYLFGWNRVLLLIAAVVGAILIIRRLHLPRTILLPGVAALMMLINYFLLSTIVEFDFLIDYERSAYADRVFEMAQFLILPLVGLTLAHIHNRVATKPLALRAGFTVLLAVVLTSALYLTYPRHDNYEISRGFNVGVSDYDTVHYIHDQNATVDYVVLANQAVSSAAMDAYGFLKYYEGDIFYYPIPTGGPLYQLYLDMVNVGPARAKAIEAMDLAHVDTAYFVVNDYWFMADKLIENAKREANSWTAISSGATYVFEYKR